MKQLFLCFFFCLVQALQLHVFARIVLPRDPLLAPASRHDTDNLKTAYLTAGSGPVSFGQWDSLLAVSRKLGMSLYECRILGKIAEKHSSNGNMRLAGRLFLSSLYIAERHDFRPEIFHTLNMLQRIYAMQFDRKRTLFYAYKGLRLAERCKDEKAIADFHSSIAVYYLTSGDLDKALSMNLQLLAKCRELGYETGIAGALVDIGSAYAAMNKRDEMTHYYLASREYASRMKEGVYSVQIYNSVAQAYVHVKQFDSAFCYNDSAYRLSTQIGNPRALASSLIVKAWISEAAGRFGQAKNYLMRALVMSESSGFTAQLPNIYNMLVSVCEKSGNFRDALKYQRLREHINDSLSDEKVRKQALEKEFAYNLEKKEGEYKLLQQRNEIQDLQLTKNRYLFVGIALLLLIVVVVACLLMRQVRFKTEHQRIRLEQKLLRSQMNPHFIFNSLNSIQQFVMKGRNDQAELYLSRFAQLIRDLLESNIKENLTVAEEISMLNAYLEMEWLRFGARFSYAIHTDEKLEPERIHIPHLMIQPFVENAIWHGLLRKPGSGNLDIRFEYHTEKTIRCIVDDNGVGREASMHHENTFRKKSLALSFVEQRIELIRKTHNIEGCISITDKKDTDNNSAGTLVTVLLPILKN